MFSSNCLKVSSITFRSLIHFEFIFVYDVRKRSNLIFYVVFQVVMYGCESWNVKKAECRRIDAFELWCWRRLLRVPWTARRSNQSILKETSPGCSLEGLMLKLKLQYFRLMWRFDSLEKPWCWEALGAGGEGDFRGWDSWMASPTRWTCVWVNSGSWWCWQGGLACCDSWGREESDTTEWLNWTEKTDTLTLSNSAEPKQDLIWQPTPVLSPGKSHGWRILVGCSPWGL